MTCQARPSLFAYPPPVTTESGKDVAKIPQAVLSTTARAKDKAKRKAAEKEATEGDKMDTEDKAPAPGEISSLQLSSWNTWIRTSAATRRSQRSIIAHRMAVAWKVVPCLFSPRFLRPKSVQGITHFATPHAQQPGSLQARSGQDMAGVRHSPRS